MSLIARNRSDWQTCQRCMSWHLHSNQCHMETCTFILIMVSLWTLTFSCDRELQLFHLIGTATCLVRNPTISFRETKFRCSLELFNCTTDSEMQVIPWQPDYILYLVKVSLPPSYPVSFESVSSWCPLYFSFSNYYRSDAHVLSNTNYDVFVHS